MKTCALTIAIPFYNGLDKIHNILSNLFNNKNVDYEILLIDDCSETEQTEGLLNLIENSYSNGNLRYLYNSVNLGMDSNFEKCIFESHGKYIWFFGQDDFVTIDNLYYCKNLLVDYEPDIVFANYSINRSWNYNSSYVFNSNLNTHSGIGVLDFLKVSKKKVPSFLPSLIIRKDSWPLPEVVSKFYGTHFIQLAAFLYNLSLDKKWLYIGKPLAVGEIPSSGWQKLLENRYKYYVGFMSCLNKINMLKLKNSDNLISEQLEISFLQHLFLSIECRLNKKNHLLFNLSDMKIFPKKNRYFSKIIYFSPIFLLYFFQIVRNFYYNFQKRLSK